MKKSSKKKSIKLLSKSDRWFCFWFNNEIKYDRYRSIFKNKRFFQHKMKVNESFQLILRDKIFRIPTEFALLNDINQDILHILKLKGVYEINSQISEDVFQSFLDNWVNKKTPQINLYNIYEYEQISQEFDRMKDIVSLFQHQKPNIIISPILNQNHELHRIHSKVTKSIHNQKLKYHQIIEIIFQNYCNNDKSHYTEFNKEIITACQQEDLNLINYLTQKKVKIQGFSFILNEKEKTATIFRNNSTREKIFIPRSITYKSKEFIITSIGENSFSNERNIKFIEFSKNSEIKTIGKNSFSYTLLKKIIIPSSVIKIDEFSFSNCFKLQKVEFSENSEIKIFGEHAFHFSPIEMISIPSSIIEFKEGWCCGTLNLNIIKIFLNKNHQNISLFNNEFILGKSNSKSENFDVLLFACRNIVNAEIPDFIRIIAPFSFHKCIHLQKVSFSENSELISIEKCAFSFSSIEEISIPSNVTRIGESSFSSCFNLHSIEFVNNSKLKIIEKSAFSCSAIEKVSIPSNVTKIEEFSFSSCYKLKKVEIQENSKLISIEKDSFLNNALKSLTIPSSLIEFKSTFSKLTDIKIIKNDKNFIDYYDNKLILGKSDLNSDVFDILYFARKDIKMIKIPSFVKKIAPYSFNECTKLKKVEFSENSEINSIEDFAFSNSAIESIEIPSSVIKIGSRAFFSSKLRKIEFKNDSKLISIGEYAFSNSNIDVISIPSHVYRINEFAFSCCYLLKKINFLENSELKSIDKAAFYFTSISNISIPLKNTKFGNLAFSYCNNLKIIEFMENSSLESINLEAFDLSSNILLMIPV